MHSACAEIACRADGEPAPGPDRDWQRPRCATPREGRESAFGPEVGWRGRCPLLACGQFTPGIFSAPKKTKKIRLPEYHCGAGRSRPADATSGLISRPGGRVMPGPGWGEIPRAWASPFSPSPERLLCPGRDPVVLDRLAAVGTVAGCRDSARTARPVRDAGQGHWQAGMGLAKVSPAGEAHLRQERCSAGPGRPWLVFWQGALRDRS